ncbi:MAG: hypothetical protein R6V16_07640, partial [Bacteroidales bacterium]
VDKRRLAVQQYEPYQEFLLPAWIYRPDIGETSWDLYSLFGRDLENKIAEGFGLNHSQLFELERDIREAVSIRKNPEDIESENDAENSLNHDQKLNIELISEPPGEKAVRLFMYAVGVGFYRWDIRIANDLTLAPKLPDPFDPLPVCPPSMLVSPDGLPASPNHIVSEEWLRARPDANTLPPENAVNNPTIPDSQYPLRISWNGIMVDDPGIDGTQLHHEDIVRRVREALDVIWGHNAHNIEQEACGPAPTVLPPSRIAKRNPWLIATG